MTDFQAVILSIIEGLTEFLPISSTGHMIIASHQLGIHEDQFVKNFEVIIQFFAILAVVLLYWKKFFPILSRIEFYKKILWAFLPTAVLGFLLKKKVDVWLESTEIVAWSLMIGGIILIWSDRYFKHQLLNGRTVEDLSVKDSLKLGFFQAIAMIPGVSRSGSTILGGLFLGMNKKEATEFSFFLAVPTMAAATGYKLLKVYSTFETSQIKPLFIGGTIAFVVSILAIKFFISIVGRFGFTIFGIYRIALGGTILALIYGGHL